MAFKKVEESSTSAIVKEKNSIKPLILGTLAQAVSATAEATGTSAAEVTRCMMLKAVEMGFRVGGYEIEGQESAELLLHSARDQLKEIAKEAEKAKETKEVAAKEESIKEKAVEAAAKPSVGLSMPPPLKKMALPVKSKSKSLSHKT